ncbi:phosphotransferase [Parasediminibacterium sp. JCM 36343]|uniref:RapZ C-terminal domain-containing protein n=1 Tax=Parasediminibacterium sp. JCM 36343 TaxID=3374279 RepID=UPI00397A7BEB
MEFIKGEIEQLFAKCQQQAIGRIEKLPQSGSNREYYRIYTSNQSFIATYNENVQENKAFIHFTEHFKKTGLPVPVVFCTNENTTMYIQEDKGTESLLNQIEKHGKNEYVYDLFKKSLRQLAKMQIIGHEGFDYNFCLTAKEFGKQAITNDLLYFKYYFLDTLGIPYDKQALLEDFETLSTYLSKIGQQYFMFRDFQSRNILVQNDEVFFIDYQGGMKGALQYDVASLLWQAKANLSEGWKNSLLNYYINEAECLLGKAIDRTAFISQYNGYVLIRLLQVLGAYGFRGLFERKAHFLTSIPFALQNIQFFLANKKVGINMPVFEKLLQKITSPEIIASFTPVQANENTPLVIAINSFSYKKGIPATNNDTGGGYVFDMRAILNPGRNNEYKKLSGKDKPVQDFLEQRTLMNNFLNSVWDLIDISVENYIDRSFENLVINFGCTGGQHRSVYAAEQTARHLRNKYKVKVVITHTNEANWVK